MASSAVISRTILGKRARDSPLILHLVPSPEPSCDQSGPEFDELAIRPKAHLHILINGVLVPNTVKRYKCAHLGCNKSYSKPSRLAEHERSHTGQRPFVCDTCDKSYLREAHLQAHSRSHLPESSRPLLCPKDSCGKRFWTQQHLRVHTDWHDGAKPLQCHEANCGEAFAKHHQLRAHICAVHAPPGTKPYQCSYEGCEKSFGTNQHLRTHLKVHDERRYTCVHTTCLPSSGNIPIYYPTWTALQHHIRTDHPPTCVYGSCNGRTFSSQKSLRAHQRLHEQCELEQEMGDALGSDAEDTHITHYPRKRRRGGEIGRYWQCDVDGCEKDFKSKKALQTHVNVSHLGRRDHICPHEDCGRAYGYKHLLQRHLAKTHNASSADGDDTPDFEESDDLEWTLAEKASRRAKATTSLDIDTITGQSYAKRTHTNITNATALLCPYPHMDRIAHVTHDDTPRLTQSITSLHPCEYAFSRAYDLRRHLRAAHKVDAVKESLDKWVQDKKTEWSCPSASDL